MSFLAKTEQDRIAWIATLMAATEIVVGSVLHGFKLPLGGQFLSLVQMVFLTIVAKDSPTYFIGFKSPLYVSSISACLKSLSPAGNKLGPMLSIWMQGFLFSVGVLFFGKNRVGMGFGGALASVWAFVQPIITLYLFFGESLRKALEFYLQKIGNLFGVTTDQLATIGFSLIGFKIAIAFGLCSTVVPYFSQKILQGSENLFYDKKHLVARALDSKKNPKTKSKKIAYLALKDLTQPFFMFSFLLGFIFFWFSVSKWSSLIWLTLRPLGIAYLFFLVSRSHLIPYLLGELGQRKKTQNFFSIFRKSLLYTMKDRDLDEANHPPKN